jgi:hypothetical protein
LSFLSSATPAAMQQWSSVLSYFCILFFQYDLQDCLTCLSKNNKRFSY